MALVLNGTTGLQYPAGGSVNLYEDSANGTNFIGLKAPASVAADKTFVLPGTDGITGQYLKTDGSGNLGFASLPTFPSGTIVGTTDTQTLTNKTWNGVTIGVAYGGTGATTLTGLVKGNGTSAFTAATAGTDYVAPGTATSFTATQSFNGSTVALATNLTNAAEVTTISATAATGTIVFYPSVQSVLYYTSNASANWTTNITFSSGTTLNSVMVIGQSMTIAHLVTQGATAYYNSSIQVDGTTSGVTTIWQGGSPTKGNASGVDVYTYTIIKTGLATFTVLASLVQFK